MKQLKPYKSLFSEMAVSPAKINYSFMNLVTEISELYIEYLDKYISNLPESQSQQIASIITTRTKLADNKTAENLFNDANVSMADRYKIHVKVAEILTQAYKQAGWSSVEFTPGQRGDLEFLYVSLEA